MGIYLTFREIPNYYQKYFNLASAVNTLRQIYKPPA
jgi:hypothetical protein